MTVAARDLVPAELREEWRAAGYYPDRDLFGLFLDQAGTRPDQTAVVDDAGSVDYATLAAAAGRVASTLAAAGVGPGDVVGVQVPNSWQACAVDLAVAAVGALCMPYPVLYRERETAMLLGRSGAVAAIVAREFGGHDFLKMVDTLRPDLPGLRDIFVVGEADGDARSLDGALDGTGDVGGWSPIDIDPRRPARILVTSGTETAPKMVLYSHDGIGGGIGNIVAGLQPDDMRTYCLVPLSSGFGAIGTFATLARLGGTLVVSSAFEPGRVLRTIATQRPTHLLGVPTMLVMLLAHDDLPSTDTSSLKVVATYGAAVAQSVVEEARAGFGCAFVSGYGCSDGASSQTSLDDPAEKVAGTVGRPNPAVSVLRVVDEEGNDLPARTEGEIWARGPLSPLCYLNSPELDGRYRADGGWTKTGDLGVVDDKGYVRIVGRLKDIIIRGGYNVSPAETEELLQGHPAVLHAACVGMPDARLGERMCAYVVLREGAAAPTLEEVQSFLLQRGLAKNKLPEHLEVIEQMPLNPAGKILKRVLRDRIAETLQSEPTAHQ